MASDLLRAVHERINEDIDGLSLSAEGLRASIDARFGELVLEIDHDRESEAVRVSVRVAPPAGAGSSFLIWCLSANVQFWDVKIGLDEDGHLRVHSDMDAPEGCDLDALAAEIVDRADTVVDLLDDDAVEWLLANDLGTPAQRERWNARAGAESDDDVDD
ncbi:MAG: hypothetical protein OEY14_16755 [Myxococcales bacterium]|nr:hypothetical protein [Myxococcales bacterium]